MTFPLSSAAAAVTRLSEAGFTDIDSVSLRDAATLQPIDALGEARDPWLVSAGCDFLQGYLFAKPGRPFPTFKW